MNYIETYFLPLVQAIWEHLVPHGNTTSQPFWSYVLGSLSNSAKAYFWFLIIGIFIYLVYLRKKDQPLSTAAAIKHLLPAKIYKHKSFSVDMSMVPISWALNFMLFAGLAVGAGAVQIWLTQEFGAISWSVSAGWLAITLQILFTLLGVDIGRFAWHYQAHFVEFFWEFHKGHHTPEVLHPVFIRTHPVDMLIRLVYMNMGGGVIGGMMMYMAGVNASTTAVTYLVFISAFLGAIQRFEHSHVPLSFGKTLNKVFYPPCYHPFHHSAKPEHRNVNLGRPCGLLIWDKLFGTLHIPRPGEFESLVFGSSLQELGDNNPHRSLWRFLTSPFVESFKTLSRDRSKIKPAEV